MRVLVMEDNWLIAEAIADSLRQAGVAVVGPVADTSRGMALARAAEIDGAVLDIKLADGHCFGAATILRLRGVPFVFLSGYQDADLIPYVFRTAKRLQKLQDLRDLPAIVQETFASH